MIKQLRHYKLYKHIISKKITLSEKTGRMQMKRKIILAIFITLAVFSANGCGEKAAIPDELIGEWQTSEPKYEGCNFEVTELTVAFKPKSAETYSNIITNVKREENPNEEHVLYTIFYKMESGKIYQLSLNYYPEDNGVIRFKNQIEIVWTKKRAY